MFGVWQRDVCISESKSPCECFRYKVNWIESAGEEKGSEITGISLSNVYLFLFLPSSKVPSGRNPESNSPEAVPVS